MTERDKRGRFVRQRQVAIPGPCLYNRAGRYNPEDWVPARALEAIAEPTLSAHMNRMVGQYHHPAPVTILLAIDETGQLTVATLDRVRLVMS